ncbi:MAG: hypothetical protein IPJ41_12500 [Phycisphaerales bacterium]|nr:hypothetical protein [Phycisphaerales bacterium]
MTRTACLVAFSLLTGVASAQVASLHWEFDDPNGNGTLLTGQQGTFTLMAGMDRQGTPFTGFAGTIYDITAVGDCWAMGTVNSSTNFLSSLTDDGTLQGNNDILGVESFQLPPLFNPDFDASNPIALYEIKFTADGLSPGVVVLSSTHLNFDVYTDTFGTSIHYAYNDSALTFRCVPTPATSTLAFVGLAALGRRRRA